jgi:hypothetical protein
MDCTPLSVVKVNVDVDLSKNTSIASAATIVKDEEGRFMGALALVLQGIIDAKVMESIVCRKGMALALASDCLNVMKSIQQGDLGIYGHVIRKINARKTTF